MCLSASTNLSPISCYADLMVSVGFVLEHYITAYSWRSPFLNNRGYMNSILRKRKTIGIGAHFTHLFTSTTKPRGHEWENVTHINIGLHLAVCHLRRLYTSSTNSI